MRYQRGARRHLISPREWQQGCKARDKTRQYMSTCSKLVGPVALASEMEGWACARGDMQAHGRFCVGATSFCPKVIHNWRVLWYSMPSINRRELLLKSSKANLEDHRAKGGSNETWRMQYTFLGKPVCRDALILLTGMTSYLLGQARDAALQGNNSALSVQEVGIHACIRNHAKAHVYLSARQWLENYASTHAEMSPMDYKAFLPSGRKVFYYYQYRKDTLERHGCLLGQWPSEQGSTPRPSNVEPSTPTPKRGRTGPTPHSRNDQDVPSGKKRRGRLNPHSLGEQSVLGGTPQKDTAFAS